MTDGLDNDNRAEPGYPAGDGERVMALIAEVKMTILNLAAKKVRFVGTVTDNVTGQVITGDAVETVVKTDDLQNELVRVTSNLFAQYERAKAKEDAKAALIATWESALASALQTRVDE